MDSLIQDALRLAAPAPTQEKGVELTHVKITVIGVGGGGTNTVHRLTKMGLKSAETIAINTDANHLKMIDANKRVLIGKTRLEDLEQEDSRKSG